MMKAVLRQLENMVHGRLTGAGVLRKDNKGGSPFVKAMYCLSSFAILQVATREVFKNGH